MLVFSYIDKGRLDEELRPLFPILYANMNAIAPTGEGYEKDFAEWFGAVRPALEKPARNIILIRDGGGLAGFFQYYVNETTFMMEEIQFVPRLMGIGAFEALYKHLRSVVPESTPFVEAYAHRLNLKSQGILRHMGLEPIGEADNCIRFRGSCARLFEVMEKSAVKAPEFTVI